jgi:hypothetical protein
VYPAEGAAVWEEGLGQILRVPGLEGKGAGTKPRLGAKKYLGEPTQFCNLFSPSVSVRCSEERTCWKQGPQPM